MGPLTRYLKNHTIFLVPLSKKRTIYYCISHENPSRLLSILWSTHWSRDQTSWSLLGPGVEVGLAPNIMKGINIFTTDVIKDFPYNYDKIIQVLWKKGNKKKKSLLWKCLKWCHMTFWNFRLYFEPSGLPPLTTNHQAEKHSSFGLNLCRNWYQWALLVCRGLHCLEWRGQGHPRAWQDATSSWCSSNPHDRDKDRISLWRRRRRE